MSVLESLRKGTDNTSTRFLIGVVAAVFIFWGVGKGNRDTTSVYATVNGTAITDSDFRRAFALEARAAGKNLSDEEEEALAGRVLDELIQEEALVQEAERLGIAVADEEIVRRYVNDPSFQVDGKFDERTYERLLKANGFSRAQFEDRLRRDLLVSRLYELASHAVTVTDAEVREAYLRAETTLDLSFVRLPPTAFFDGIVIPDAERDAFVAANADKLKARYDEDYERSYNLEKRYELRSILLRNDIPGVDAAALRARAESIRAEALGGADFGELVRRWSEDITASNGGQLGLLAVDQLDATVAAAADAAGVGKVTDIVESSRGLQILFVDKIEQPRVISFDEARNDIALAMMKEERAPAAAEAFGAQIVGAWTSAGAPPDALLAEKGLYVESTGSFNLAAAEVPRLGDDPVLLAQIEKAAVGYVVPTPLKIKGNVFVVGVASRVDADPAGFDAKSEGLARLLRLQRFMSFREQWASDVLATASVDRRRK